MSKEGIRAVIQLLCLIMFAGFMAAGLLSPWFAFPLCLFSVSFGFVLGAETDSYHES